MTRRLFIGGFVMPELSLQKYDNVQVAFKNVTTGRWAKPEQLHFTMKFLGDVDEERISNIHNLLKDYLRLYPETIKISGIRCSPNTRAPRILYAGVHDSSGQIVKIHSEIENLLKSEGFKEESRKFTPHITLQRIKSINVDEFQGVLKEFDNYEFGIADSFAIELIESKLTPMGSIYTALRQDGFGG
jgi:2'-5' RNA ligase